MLWIILSLIGVVVSLAAIPVAGFIYGWWETREKRRRINEVNRAAKAAGWEDDYYLSEAVKEAEARLAKLDDTDRRIEEALGVESRRSPQLAAQVLWERTAGHQLRWELELAEQRLRVQDLMATYRGYGAELQQQLAGQAYPQDQLLANLRAAQASNSFGALAGLGGEPFLRSWDGGSTLGPRSSQILPGIMKG
jgi:hypothetical protein